MHINEKYFNIHFFPDCFFMRDYCVFDLGYAYCNPILHFCQGFFNNFVTNSFPHSKKARKIGIFATSFHRKSENFCVKCYEMLIKLYTTRKINIHMRNNFVIIAKIETQMKYKNGFGLFTSRTFCSKMLIYEK